MVNLKAGIGDPYWYEWSIGLLYTLDMLDPDNKIKHVVLQHDQLQGLDDVVVVHDDDQAECIQIKHTRENDSLTFSDMIAKSEEKESYLRRFCTDWDKTQNQNQRYRSCKAILFTNRDIGTRKNTPADSWERPALDKFWREIKTKANSSSSISEISVRPEWQEAWEHWLDEMSDLDDVKKLGFLKSFEIKSNQEDLDAVINDIALKLECSFKIERRKAVQLHQNLCYALMTWATTMRVKQEITKEDLFAALSLCNDEMQGEHSLPTCEPFFKSRIEFSCELEGILKERKFPVVFLSGAPGAGKTNIVNYIANKIDSVITLRFHAFKPLSAEDLYMSADKGISEPTALWGNFLIQLRGLFKGRLSKYSVPVSNELLASVEEMRCEVLRLSSVLANEMGVTTIIAIDGIDHAARAGGGNTFLSTLIPPEGVPENVCFLISGQPILQYDQYPDWLADSEKVLTIDVPSIDECDIKQLYDEADIKIPHESTDVAVKLISKTVTGNTLSAIFAIHEAKRCNSIEELEHQLENKQLSSGVSGYYEYIWKSAKENIPSQFFYVDTFLAGVFSLINKKITSKLMAEICSEENIPELAWQRVMQLLYPIVVAHEGKFMVFHNDVRIYLEKYIRKDTATFVSVASRLADYYRFKSDDIKIKHEIIFELLKYANRESEYVDVFTREFVVEAIKAKRPIYEIIEQLEETFRSLVNSNDLKKTLKLSCAAATLYQYMQSLQWLDKQHEAEFELPVVLNSEKRVIPRTLITPSVLLQMLEDTSLLIDCGEFARAQNNLNRWLANLAPENIQDLLILNQERLGDINQNLNEEMNAVLVLWGRLAQYINVNFGETLDRQIDPEKAKAARRYFNKGWLDEGKKFLSEQRIEVTIKRLNYFFTNDLEAYINAVFETNNEDLILRISQPGLREKFSNILRVKFVVWSLLNNKLDAYRDWFDQILHDRFSYIKIPSDGVYDVSRHVFPLYSLIAIVLSYDGLDRKTIIQECLTAYGGKDFKPKDRGYSLAHNLILASSFFGYLLQAIKSCQNRFIGIDDFACCVTHLFEKHDSYVAYSLSADIVEEFLLKQIVSIVDKLDPEFRTSLLEIFIQKASEFSNLKHINIYWEYLSVHNQTKVLEELFDKWMSVDGLVWQQESADMDKLAEEFIARAVKLAWVEKVENAKKCLENKLISYSGRKEYSIYSLLNWYERICDFNTACWESIGIELLNVSQFASDTGDNRADIDVQAEVAISAGKHGIESLWSYSNLKNTWDDNWVRRIFDGVIAALQYSVFTEEELLAIWELSSKVFYVCETANSYDSDNTLRLIYIADIKEAILHAAERFQYVGIGESMIKVAQVEFSKTRDSNERSSFRIPTRWFDSAQEINPETVVFLNETSNLSCMETLGALEYRFYNDRKSFRWDFVAELISKIKQNPQEKIDDFLPRILGLLLQRNDAYYWEWDGANRVYEMIFDSLNEEQITAVVNDMIRKYFELNDFSRDAKLLGLKNDLDDLSFSYYSRLTEKDNVEAINELLSMHVDWITGDKRVRFTKQFQKNNELVNIANWGDFCKEIKDKIFCDY